MTTRRWLMDEWRDSFLLELRMRKVPGARIGEALAEIETHCADSGQSPGEAFGDPVAYAQALAHSLRAEAAGGTGSPWLRYGLSWRNGLGAFAILGGILSLLEGIDAVAHTTPGVVTAGQITSTVVCSLLALALPGLIVGSGRQGSKGKFVAVVVAGFYAAMAPQIFWTRPVLHTSGWVLLGTALVLLVLAWRLMLAGRIRGDRVVDPRTGREPFKLPRHVLAVAVVAPIVVLLGVVLLTVLLPASRR